mmetsp:Transcript_21543/g.47367  ORF Transcript_21543/g.47367 Transcript_21543/m.47367 type:complete len:373 (-) Transcript_21543:53-1171(-)
MRALSMLLAAVQSLQQPDNYILVSTPSRSMITVYQPGGNRTQVLLAKGLVEPYGMAIDDSNGRLYIADPGAGQILMTKLKTVTEGGERKLQTHGGLISIKRGVQVRNMACDFRGDLYFSDEAKNQILRISSGQLDMMAKSEQPVTDDRPQEELIGMEKIPNPRITTVFTRPNTTKISAPGGIAVDATVDGFMFWANKKGGETAGSLTRALLGNFSAAPESMGFFGENTYGVCLTHNNVFTTSKEKNIRAMPKRGGESHVITESLLTPRGCAFDGDGSVYVADWTGNAVYSIPGNMLKLGPQNETKVFEVEAPYGMAMYHAPEVKSSTLASVEAAVGWGSTSSSSSATTLDGRSSAAGLGVTAVFVAVVAVMQ